MRFAAMRLGTECNCFSDMPNEHITAVAEDRCRRPCVDDDKQFCGAHVGDFLQIFVATCPSSLRRFGDSCYKANYFATSVLAHSDDCTADVGSVLTNCPLHGL